VVEERRGLGDGPARVRGARRPVRLRLVERGLRADRRRRPLRGRRRAVGPPARRDAYALSKAAGESLALALHRTTLFPVTAARLFNVVGPRQSERYGMVLPRFAAAAVRGEALTVHGDGRQTRCFLHVADAVDALWALAAAAASEGSVVNVGSEEEVSIADLARAVVSEAGTGSPLRFVPFEQVYGEGFSDPRRRRPDASRLRRLTGFVARRSLADAVRDAVSHARARASLVPG
jgi:UDP-glucose 4-epimerase